MPIERYLNFDVRIRRESPKARQRYCVEAEGVSETFKYPFTRDREDNIGLQARARTSSSRRATDPARYDTARDIGRVLFRCALPGRVLEQWNVQRARAEKQGLGLRLRLRCPNAPEALDLPWEYAWYDESKFHLAMYENTPIVRCLDVDGEVKKLVRLERPLRILVVISVPRGQPKLKGAKEWKKMAEKFSPGRDVEFTVVERPATLSRVIDELGKREYHVFHFIGHGLFNQNTGRGELFFEDVNGACEPVDSDRMGQIMRNHASLRLAVLNSCEGGRASLKDVFGGVAQRLVQQGLPAAIGMQYEVPDQAAILFSESFYQKIAAGRPLEGALSYARLQMAAVDGMEWAIPVLYTHPNADRIFNLPPQEPPATRPVPPKDPAVPDVRDDSAADVSEYYVRRISDDRRTKLFRATGVSLVISGPGQFGRSTVLRLVEEQARKLKKRPIVLDLSDFPAESFATASELFLEFARQVARRLGRKDALPKIEDRWRNPENNIYRCGECLQEILDAIPGKPAVSLLLDGVDCLLGLPFREDFFKALRVWHGERSDDVSWRRVDLVVATSEESWSLDLARFDEISLAPFSLEEAAWLNRRRKAKLSPAQLKDLWTLVGGHPKLIQRCLGCVAEGAATAEEVTLLDRDPLASQLAFIDERVHKLGLFDSVQQVISSESCSESHAFNQLRALGVVGRYRRPVRFTCPLYRDYFRDRVHPD